MSLSQFIRVGCLALGIFVLPSAALWADDPTADPAASPGEAESPDSLGAQIQEDAAKLGDKAAEIGENTGEAAEAAGEGVAEGADDAYSWIKEQTESAYEWSKGLFD